MTSLLTLLTTACLALSSGQAGPGIEEGIKGYKPVKENIEAREKFRDDKFGIFIHWGVYSMLGQGEWVMDKEKIPYETYKVFARGFYPAQFDADEWVRQIKESGARYITITSRHHDGFSMFDSKYTDFDIMDCSPFKRDVMKELADACHKQGITLNFYYSLVDWGRRDYPRGTSGPEDKDPSLADYESYLNFMCNQITELLTNYGPIGCIWFDGDWDHIRKPKKGEEININFDWGYKKIYETIHNIQPSCLVANNHHRVPIEGEDLQVFERDVPGENAAGYSRTSHISESLPLETCKTMSKNWGYDVRGYNVWKSPSEIIRILVSTAGRNANLLLNIGPQPDGQIPPEALERFKAVGEWMAANGETIYGTRSTFMKPQQWGVATDKGKTLYLHVMSEPTDGVILLPFKPKSVKAFASGKSLKFRKGNNGYSVVVPDDADFSTDFIIEVTRK